MCLFHTEQLFDGGSVWQGLKLMAALTAGDTRFPVAQLLVINFGTAVRRQIGLC